MSLADQTLLERIAQGIARPAAPGVKTSILTSAGELYGTRPVLEDATPPTGFDPAAAALFEALVEGAYLVANADGVFDDDERRAFEAVVLTATKKQVDPSQLTALLADLQEQLAEDGVEKRIQVLASTIAKPEHQHEVLRVSALIGHISGGVSEVEKNAMISLARAFGLTEEDVIRAIDAAKQALAQ
jgi:tellurite resistance protein